MNDSRRWSWLCRIAGTNNADGPMKTRFSRSPWPALLLQLASCSSSSPSLSDSPPPAISATDRPDATGPHEETEPSVATSDFAIAIPKAQRILPGATAKIVVDVTRSNGFSGTISLALDGAPAGVEAAKTATDGTTATLTVSAQPNASLGNFTPKIVATADDKKTSTSFALHVGDKPGTVDSTFGPLGEGTNPSQPGIYARHNQGLIASADGTYLALNIRAVPTKALVLERRFGDGSLDISFGETGQAILPSRASTAHLAAAANGKIYVCAGIPNETTSSIWRLEADGSFDMSFGTGGKATIPRTDVTSLSVDDAGRAYVGGPTQGIAWLTRLTSTGDIDSTFGLAGAIAPPTDTIWRMAWTPNQDFILANIFTVQRYAQNGAVDPSLALTRNRPSYFRDIAVQKDGKLVLLTGDATTTRLERLTTYGTHDTSFGSGGVSAPITPVPFVVRPRIALHPDGSIYVAISDFDVVYLAHVLANGTLDPAWGKGAGYVTISSTSGNGIYLRTAGLAIDARGAVLVAADVPMEFEGHYGPVSWTVTYRYWP